ncbi:invasion associated locus B family protein [Hansschlegelia zhihuaiae]|uniref:Invasion associated locus B family protein n=1 Tax=Hansschlegelia zhihuaiae TaxID=405005 RepID=A0A4Q0M6N7_9HYPH|nr:invasion associated locus B family protein [Hansschlegelia zhihuaiae]RXF68728.1 hypothetical protein EK403_19365 [Hansschlegelia zhihuaiae]
MTDRAPILAAVALAAATLGASTGGAAAQAPAGAQPTQIGDFKDWTAYAAPVKGGKVCYALAQPQKARRRSAQAPEGAYFFISNRPQDGVQNEISVMPGFALKTNSEVELTVDGATFKLFTRGDGAFMGNNEDQAALVEAMRAGRRDMKVEAISTRGRSATQSYSLAGVSDALDKINAECRATAAPAQRQR